MKLKDWLVSTLGIFGYVVYYLLSVVIQFAPLLVLNLPFWADILIICAVNLIPYANLPYLGLWIWALVVAVGCPSAVTSIIFFVSFGLHFVYWLLTIISFFSEKRY